MGMQNISNRLKRVLLAVNCGGISVRTAGAVMPAITHAAVGLWLRVAGSSAELRTSMLWARG